MKAAVLGIFLVMTSINTKAGGTDVFYGGDTILTQFLDLQKGLYNDFKTIPAELISIKDFENKWNEVQRSLSISVKDHLIKDNQEIAFLNYPRSMPKKIEISRTAWNCTEDRIKFCRHAVLHEMIHLMGYDDSNYQYSTELIQKIEYWKNSESLWDWMNPLFSDSKVSEKKLSYWVFININKYSEIPNHPFFTGLKLGAEEIILFKKLSTYLKNKKNIEKNNQLLIHEIDAFLFNHEIKPIAEGLFMVGFNIYYSNGSSFCLFGNMDHLKKRTGRIDTVGLTKYNLIPSIMQDDGYCD